MLMIALPKRHGTHLQDGNFSGRARVFAAIIFFLPAVNCLERGNGRDFHTGKTMSSSFRPCAPADGFHLFISTVIASYLCTGDCCAKL